MILALDRSEPDPLTFLLLTAESYENLLRRALEQQI